MWRSCGPPSWLMANIFVCKLTCHTCVHATSSNFTSAGGEGDLCLPSTGDAGHLLFKDREICVKDTSDSPPPPPQVAAAGHRCQLTHPPTRDFASTPLSFFPWLMKMRRSKEPSGVFYPNPSTLPILRINFCKVRRKKSFSFPPSRIN